MPRWTPEDAPPLDGVVAVVTGASAGLGAATSEALTARGAHVVLATRDAVKTARVMDAIRSRVPAASLEHLPLDLADLASVARAAEDLRRRHARIDRLIANAGVMATPLRRTAQGFELQIGVNHLAHQALVARTLPLLATSPDPRVVVVSSGVHRVGRIDLDDLTWRRRRYRPWAAYAQSKLANLLFVAELARRLALAGSPVRAIAAHPGFAATDLQATGPRMRGGPSARVVAPAAAAVTRAVAQSAKQGALPQLFATIAPEAVAGAFYGPDGPGAMRGWPTLETPSAPARDAAMARALWDASEGLTGVAAELPG